MNFKKTMLASLLMISASGAFAADSASVNITGTVSPDSCNITLTGGDIDYGNITLATGATRLPEKTVGWAVDCGTTPKPISLSWVDEFPLTPLVGMYGLRAEGSDVVVGEYSVAYKSGSYTAGNAAATLLRQLEDNNNWVPESGNAHTRLSHGFAPKYALSTDGATPVVAATHAGEVIVQSTLRSSISRSSDITLEGKATVTVNYL